MKKKNLGIVAATLVVVAAGSITLVFSMTKIKGAVQEEFSSNTQITTTQGECLALVDSTCSEEEQYKEQDMEELFMLELEENESELEEQIQREKIFQQELTLLLREMQERGNKNVAVVTVTTEDGQEWEYWGSLHLHEGKIELRYEMDQNTVSYIYKGQNVVVYDALADKEEAKENSQRVMDFIFDYVDKKLFVPYEIDKTEYTYRFTRQVEMDIMDCANYTINLEKNEEVVYTIEVCLDEELILESFSMDGCENAKVPEEFDISSWCSTTAEKETVYDKYLEQSRTIVKDVLGLSSIVEAERNLESILYFEVQEEENRVIFGYVLEDGSYIRIFYNMIDESWEGFVLVDDPDDFFTYQY